jgi:hypothetical protein
MKRCNISFETLADYRDGRAQETESQRIREHLDTGCAHCRDAMAWLERTGAAMAEAQRTEVPQRLVDRLQGVFAERFRMPERRSLLARLTFDGRSPMALAGVRGGDEGAFNLSYSTELHEIDIWEEPVAPGRWYIIGQVLSRDGDEALLPGEIVLTREDGV